MQERLGGANQNSDAPSGQTRAKETKEWAAAVNEATRQYTDAKSKERIVPLRTRPKAPGTMGATPARSVQNVQGMSQVSRRMWAKKRPPAPPHPAQMYKSEEAGKQPQPRLSGIISTDYAQMQQPNITSIRGVTRSPSVASVSSASSLSTLGSHISESSWAQVGASAPYAHEWNYFLRKNLNCQESPISTSRGDDDHAPESLTSYEHIENCLLAKNNKQAGNVDETVEWVDLCDESLCNARASYDHEQQLGETDIARILQYELGETAGRSKLWRHLVTMEQRALELAPWREDLVSKKRGVHATAAIWPLQNTVKLLTRRGPIPRQFSLSAWMLSTGGAKRMANNPCGYTKILMRTAALRKTEGQESQNHENDKIFGHQQQASNRIVGALVHRNQGLQRGNDCLLFMAHFLLQDAGIGEECAFWLMCQVVEFMLQLDYFSTGFSTIVDARVLAELVLETDVELSAHLESFVDLAPEQQNQKARVAQHVPISNVLREMGIMTLIQTAFASSGCCELTKRVWDIFTFQGERVLFAAVIAILQMNRAEILASSTILEARTAMYFPNSEQDGAELTVFIEMTVENMKIASLSYLKRKRSKHRAVLAQVLAEPLRIDNVVLSCLGQALINAGAKPLVNTGSPTIIKISDTDQKPRENSQHDSTLELKATRRVLEGFHKRQRKVMRFMPGKTAAELARLTQHLQAGRFTCASTCT